jgi:hypothetical protein
MVILVAGKIEMTIGPLPYDKEECVDRAVGVSHDLSRAAEKYNRVLPPIPGNPSSVTIRISDVSIRCVESQDRPKLGERLGPAEGGRKP